MESAQTDYPCLFCVNPAGGMLYQRTGSFLPVIQKIFREGSEGCLFGMDRNMAALAGLSKCIYIYICKNKCEIIAKKQGDYLVILKECKNKRHIFVDKRQEEFYNKNRYREQLLWMEKTVTGRDLLLQKIRGRWVLRKVVDDPRLMIKVCDLYYNQNISQQQIGKTLNLSRPTVSRILSLAREEGIVKISISNLDAVEHWELERKLEQMYSLQEVIIASEDSGKEDSKTALGMAAARYLEYIIKDGNTVGVSMGSTLYQVVSNIIHPAANNVTFVPLIGGVGNVRMELHSNSLAEALSRIYHGKFVTLHAPARVSSRNIRDELMREETLLAAIRLMQKLDIAIVGIGFPNEQSSIKATEYFKENEIDSLLERKVAGELCMQFYDVSGSTAAYKDDNTVIGIDIKRLRDIPRTIGIAGGVEKIAAIRGAINGRYINTLITDVRCAQALASE